MQGEKVVNTTTINSKVVAKICQAVAILFVIRSRPCDALARPLVQHRRPQIRPGWCINRAYIIALT